MPKHCCQRRPEKTQSSRRGQQQERSQQPIQTTPFPPLLPTCPRVMPCSVREPPVPGWPCLLAAMSGRLRWCGFSPRLCMLRPRSRSSCIQSSRGRSSVHGACSTWILNRVSRQHSAFTRVLGNGCVGRNTHHKACIVHLGTKPAEARHRESHWEIRFQGRPKRQRRWRR
jgi:hypothetical protein